MLAAQFAIDSYAVEGNMGRTGQNLLHLAILIVISALFWLVQPSPEYQSHGILLPTGKSYPAISMDKVKVLGHFPPNYIDLGLIRTTHHFNSVAIGQQNQEERENLQYARLLAGRVGANAIAVTLLGRSNQIGPLDGTVLYAKAIRINNTTSSSHKMVNDN